MSSLPIRRVIFRIQQGCHLSEVLVVGGPSPEKLSLVYTMEGSDLYQSLASSILRFRENLWLLTPFIQKACHRMIKRTKFRQKHREKKKSVPINTYIMLLFWSTPCNAIVGQERKWRISARPSSRVLTITYGGLCFIAWNLKAAWPDG